MCASRFIAHTAPPPSAQLTLPLPQSTSHVEFDQHCAWHVSSGAGGTRVVVIVVVIIFIDVVVIFGFSALFVCLRLGRDRVLDGSFEGTARGPSTTCDSGGVGQWATAAARSHAVARGGPGDGL